MNTSKKNVILVDLENVQQSCLYGAEYLSEGDSKMIIFNNTAHHLYPVSDLLPRLRSKAPELKVEVSVLSNEAKNAADFFMVAYVAAEAKDKPEYTYYILSKDHGFDAAIDCIRLMIPNANIKRIDSLLKEFGREHLRKAVENALPDENKKVRKIVTGALLEARDEEKYHRLLQKSLYPGTISKIYASTKMLVVEGIKRDMQSS